MKVKFKNLDLYLENENADIEPNPMLINVTKVATKKLFKAAFLYSLAGPPPNSPFFKFN